MKRLFLSVATSACGVAVFASTLLASADASAFEFGTPARKHPYRSSQDFALEIRFSPYHPQVDQAADLHGATPYANNFGTVPRAYAGIELDWQTYRIPFVGTIGPGLGVGLVSASRNVVTVTGRASGDETSLNIYPLYGVLVLRADYLFRNLGFPLVPYVKGGLATGIWRASDSNGTSNANNVAGKGISWGTNVALGVSFALDAIDPGASRNMDNATGINGTYIFFEGQWLTLDGIAQQHALNVGSNSWTAGLAFEF